MSLLLIKIKPQWESKQGESIDWYVYTTGNRERFQYRRGNIKETENLGKNKNMLNLSLCEKARNVEWLENIWSKLCYKCKQREKKQNIY